MKITKNTWACKTLNFWQNLQRKQIFLEFLTKSLSPSIASMGSAPRTPNKCIFLIFRNFLPKVLRNIWLQFEKLQVFYQKIAHFHWFLKNGNTSPASGWLRPLDPYAATPFSNITLVNLHSLRKMSCANGYWLVIWSIQKITGSKCRKYLSVLSRLYFLLNK